MPDPWLTLSWSLVAVLALAYIGAAVQAYLIWRPDRGLWWQHLAVAGLAAVWPWAVGAVAVRWIKDLDLLDN